MKTSALLFVCLGNICRSPAAEEIMRQVLKRHNADHRVSVDSAGIGSWHVGQLPDPRMRRHGLRNGYDFSSRARQVTRQDFQRFDLIFAMDEDNFEALSDLAPSGMAKKIRRVSRYLTNHPGQTTIPDPYYGGDAGFQLVIDLLEDACENIYKALPAEGLL